MFNFRLKRQILVEQLEHEREKNRMLHLSLEALLDEIASIKMRRENEDKRRAAEEEERKNQNEGVKKRNAKWEEHVEEVRKWHEDDIANTKEKLRLLGIIAESLGAKR